MKLSYREQLMLKNPCWLQEVREIVEPLLASKMKFARGGWYYAGYVLSWFTEIDLSCFSDRLIAVVCSLAKHTYSWPEKFFTNSFIEDLSLIPETATRLLLLEYGPSIELPCILERSLKCIVSGYQDELIADFISCFSKLDYAHVKSPLHVVFRRRQLMETVMEAYSSVPQSLRESFVYAMALGQTPKEAQKNCCYKFTRTAFTTAYTLDRASYKELRANSHKGEFFAGIPFVFDEKIIGRESMDSKLQKLERIGRIFRQIVCHPNIRKYKEFVFRLVNRILSSSYYELALAETLSELRRSLAGSKRKKMPATEINDAFEKNDVIKLCKFATGSQQINDWVSLLGTRPIPDCIKEDLSAEEVLKVIGTRRNMKRSK